MEKNQTNKSRSLSRTLVLDYLAIIVSFGILAILAISFFTFKSFQKEAIRDSELSLLNGETIIEQFFENHFEQMKILALSAEIRALDAEGSMPYLEGMLRQNSEYIDIALVSSSGREVVKVSRHEFIPRESLKSHTTESHFKQAMAGKKVLEDVVFEEGRPTAALVVPVQRNPLEIVGFIEARIDLLALSQWIGKMQFGEAGVAYLVNREGLIIAHTEPKYALGETKAVDIPSVAAAMAGQEVVPYGPYSRYKNFLGKRVVAGAKHLKSYGYVLAVERDENEMVSNILPYFLGLLGVALAALISGFFWITARVKRKVVEPIALLARKMQAFEEGKEFVAVKLENKGEIGYLVQSFNKMAQSLSGAMQELRLSQNRLSTILENIPQGVFLLNSHGAIEYASLTVAKETNILHRDLASMEVKSFMSPAYQPKYEEEWERMKKELTPFSLEMEYLTARGKWEPGLIFVAPLSNLDGRFAGAVLLGVNLTKVKEEEKKRSREEKLALLGLMASKLSHELRSPLEAMGNSVYYLKHNLKNDEDKIKRHLDMLGQQVESSTHLIASILDFTRPKEPVFYPVNLNLVLQRALEQTPLPQGVETEQALDSSLPSISGDAQLLTQVFVNLITNACQAMPKGGKITLRTRAEIDMIAAEVQDVGVGIEPEFMKEIFQPFHSNKARGMGLGLSICQDIVERHGGRIEVQSEPGQGSIFSVFLPLKKGM